MNKITGKEGIYKANVWIDRFCKLEKTFFPQSWSTEKVMSKITEAYENILSMTLERDGKYYITGCTSEGIIIEIRMTPKGEILSAYPSADLNHWG